MAVQVWIGEKPEHPTERRAIMALVNGLHHMDGLYLILANFSVGGRTVDLVIIKQDAIFILELKHCDGRVIGSVNGPWLVEGRNGERKRLNPGRKNPYNQVISYFHGLTNFLNEHRREFLSDQKAKDLDFRTCKRAVVIAPVIQEGSEIELDWKVELKGMDELPSYLITERSSEIELSEEEMLAIPRLLHCTPWHEINLVLRGVVPNPDDLADPLDEVTLVPLPPDPTQPALEASPVAEPDPVVVSPAAPADAPWLGQVQQALTTTTGRVAALLAGVALFLALVLVLRPAPPLPLADQPAPIILAAVSLPTGEALAASAEAERAACTWSGLHLVGKRYDASNRTWVSVADGLAATTPPEVVVALEQVSTCDGHIALSWSVQNNWDRPIEFPLQADNIRISDGLGNDYPLDDAASQPEAVIVAPGSQERGTTVTSRPLSTSATSLMVRLRDQPFGEASFVVALRP